MRTGKILGYTVGGIAVLFAATLLAVWWLVNPNVYKSRIEAAVKEATGRTLTLQGDIKLSVFPWIALELGSATLGNPPGFGAEPFLSVSQAAVRVRLLPLLSKRLEIATIEVDGLDVRLLKDAQGHGNWETLGRSTLAAPDTVPGTPGERSLDGLSNIRIRGGRLSYRDLVIENLSLETGVFDLQRVLPVNLSFDFNPGAAGERLSVNAKFDLSPAQSTRQFRVAALNLSGVLSRPNDGSPVHWDIAAPALDVDFAAQSADAGEFTMSYSSARVTGKMRAVKFIEDPTVSGTLTLATVQIRELAPRLGLILPPTRDEKALAQLTGTADFAYDAVGMRFANIQMRLDDTQIGGNLAVQWQRRTVSFAVSADRIDVDRYLGPSSSVLSPEPKSVEAAPAAKTTIAPGFNVNGTFAVGALHASRFDFNGLKLTVDSHDGLTRLYPLQAAVDGGRYVGDITIDRRGTVPVISVDEHLAGVDVGRLTTGDLQQKHLSGNGTVNLKATARGANINALLRSMDGHVEASVTGGAFEGVDLNYDMSRAEALIQRDSAPPKPNTGRTTFDVLKTSADITNGIATTHDLTISSQVLKVTGRGTANLWSKALDIELLASITQSSVTLADVPVHVTGTYLDPTVKADIGELAKGQIEQKIDDVLKKNGLRALFGK